MRIMLGAHTVLVGAEPESGGSDVCLPLWERLERGSGGGCCDLKVWLAQGLQEGRVNHGQGCPKPWM